MTADAEPLLCVTVTGPTMEEIRRTRDAARRRRPRRAAPRPGRSARTSPARSKAGAVPSSSPAGPPGRAAASQGSEEERRRILESALGAGRRVRRRRGGGGVRPRPDPRARAAAASSCRPTCFGASAGRSSTPATARCARPAPKSPSSRCRCGARGDTAAVRSRQPTDRRRPATGTCCIAMGSQGVPSRVLAARLGNRWTYAGDDVAPGQLPAARLLAEFRFRRIAADAALYGVVGNPIMHSLSPVMHNAGFAALRLDAVYVPLHASDADDFVAFARARTARRQHHGAVQGRPDAPGRRARSARARVGAINTLTVRDGRWLGANTDVEGFLRRSRGACRARRARASTVLGVGRRRARRRCCARRAGRRGHRLRARRGRARDVAALADGAAGALPPPPGSWDVLVNATTWAARRRQPQPDGGRALDGRLVFDLRLRPGRDDAHAPTRARRVHDHRRARDARSRRPNGSSRSGRANGRRRGSSRPRRRDAVVRRRTAGSADDASGSDDMKQTTFEEFVDLARRGTFVPVVKEIIADLLTPVSAFLKIAEHSDYAFLFESVEGGERVARYSFLGKDPFLVLRARDGSTTIDRVGHHDRERRAVRAGAAPPDGRVPVAVRARVCRASPAAPSVHRLRRLAALRAGARRRRGRRTASRPIRRPAEDDAGFMLFDTVLAFDHVKHRILIIANARITADEDLQALYQFACAKIQFLERELEREPVAAEPGERAGAEVRRTRRARSSRPASGRSRSTSPPATSTRRCCPSASRPTSRPTRSPSIARCATSTRRPTCISSGWAGWRSSARRPDAGPGRRAARRDPSDRGHAAARDQR